MRPVHKSITPLTPDPNGIFEDQTTGGAGNLTLDGALVSDGSWTSSDGTAHQISFESAGDISGVTITITGTDADDNAITEDVTGPNATTVESSSYFKTVTQIAVDGAVGTNMEGGPVDELVTNTIPLDHYRSEAALGIDLSGTANFTVQHTFANVLADGTSSVTWYDHDTLTSISTTTDGNYDKTPSATRLKLNSYTAGCSLTYHILTSAE